MTDIVAPPIINKVALLTKTFPGLPEEEVREIAQLTRTKTYPADYFLCHEGVYEDTSYVIADGEAIITQKVKDSDTERVLRKVGWGDYVGEMAPIQNAPRAASIRTLTECVVLEISRADLEYMLSRSPRMALNILRGTLARLRQNDQVAIHELQRTNKVLAQLDRNKLEFIEVAAHELRTPLTVMKGYINVMKMDGAVKNSPMLVEVLEGLSKGTDRLHEIVNTMLDVTRVDSDKVKVALVPVPIKSVVNDIVHHLRADISNRKLTLTIEHAPNTPNINADPTMVHKALYHIIVNAIKYTPDGGTVLVRTRPITMEKNVPAVEISVQDTGIGIDAEHHDLIFEKFYQVGSVDLHSSGKTAFKGGGPGLGLAIARGVARAHGGKVWVESVGHDEAQMSGSIFYFQLPTDPVLNHAKKA